LIATDRALNLITSKSFTITPRHAKRFMAGNHARAVSPGVNPQDQIAPSPQWLKNPKFKIQNGMNLLTCKFILVIVTNWEQKK
jgi:hypothetical protein